MDKTLRLYDENVDLRAFEARVLSCEPVRGGWAAVLDRTAFFPEGGGQGADLGTLGGARVLDTQIRDGVITHTVDRPLTPGEAVTGEIDWERRFSMMQQHTGEHILTGIAHGLFGVENVGFHIGTEAVTVDFDLQLTDEQIRQTERLANEAVWRDLPVQIRIPPREELSRIPYRSKKELEGDVRIVTIEGVDICACCGTHVHTTGQVGAIRVIGHIHYKGGVRLSILCGARALAWERDLLEENRAVSHALSARQGELAAAVNRLLAERDGLKTTLENLAAARFAELAAQETGEIRLAVCPGLPGARLRKAAGQLASGARLAVLLVPSETGGWQFALSGSADVRPAAQRLMARFGGRGGGPADMVQGVLTGGSPEEIRAALSEA